jgi:FtsZ-interacting cell division protein ZipA
MPLIKFKKEVKLIIIGIIVILLLLFIGIEISAIVTNTHFTNRYLNDIKAQLDEVVEYKRDKQKE